MLRASQINVGLLFVAALAAGFSGCGDGDSVDDASGGAGSAGDVGGAGKSSGAGAAGKSGAASNGGGAGHGTAGASGHASGGGAGEADDVAGASNGGGTSGGGTSGGGMSSGGMSSGGMSSGGMSSGGMSSGGTSGEAGTAGHDDLAGAGGEAGAGANPSVGADGDLVVATAMNVSTDNSGVRTCADGGDAVNYSVTALGTATATLAAAPAIGCLNVGDEVLLINLQGTASDSTNVGNYETLKVSAVNGSDVSFSAPKTRFYGNAAADDSNIGLDRANQRVMLQRVPNYASLTVDATSSLGGSAWDGVKGGVLFVRATGAVSIAGTVSMSGKGYDGGPDITDVNTNGRQGESFQGLGSDVATASKGGGGGGIGDGHSCLTFGTSGGGAAYGAPGTAGSTLCSGAAGETYGEPSLLLKLMLGSGAGSGGSDDYLGDNPPGGFGGRGGGIVVILAQQLTVTGNVLAAGTDGRGDPANFECDDGSSVTSCWDYSGPGGGGSGGSILFNAAQATLGADLVSAAGGLGSYGSPSGKGGDGGVGRIALQSSGVPSGSTVPVATID